MLITEEHVDLLTRVFIADFLPKYHLYSVRNTSESVQCLYIEDLPDIYPLASYVLQGFRFFFMVVPLKHSVVSH